MTSAFCFHKFVNGVAAVSVLLLLQKTTPLLIVSVCNS